MAYLENIEETDLVATTIVALDKRLEDIRREQLARNRSALRELSFEQLQQVELLTSAITEKIFLEVATELRHSAAECGAPRACEMVSLTLGLF
jgi:biotin-(acetyl-CoA carboxylase) ligase